MTLGEAIDHLDEVIKTIKCEECKAEHIQLQKWLCELYNRRIYDEETKRLRENISYQQLIQALK